MKKVLANVGKYQGKLVPTSDHVERDEPMPKSAWQPPEGLSKVSSSDADFGFPNSRDVQQEAIFVVLYIRVSTTSQVKGGSMAGQLRRLLDKSARFNLTVAAIAVEVKNATGDARTAIKHVDALMHNGRAHCVACAEISRLDRREGSLVMRAMDYTNCASWIYWSASYDDPHLRFFAWSCTETREKAEDAVRRAEIEELTRQGRVSTTVLEQCEKGRLIGGRKVDRFFMYRIASKSDGKYIERLPSAKARFEWLRLSLVKAVRAGSYAAVQDVVVQASKKCKKEITLDSLWDELARGLPLGVNPPSKDSPDRPKCSKLAIPGATEKRMEQLLENVELADELRPRRKRNQPSPDELVHDEHKEKMSELERNHSFNFRATCECRGPDTLTPLATDHVEDESEPGRPRLFAYCPECKTKARFPLVRDYRRSDARPLRVCFGCHTRNDLRHVETIRTEHMDVQIHKCRVCIDAAPVVQTKWQGPEGQLDAGNGTPDDDVPAGAANQDTEDVVLTPTQVLQRIADAIGRKKRVVWTTAELMEVVIGRRIGPGERTLRSRYQSGWTFAKKALEQDGYAFACEQLPGSQERRHTIIRQ